MAWLPGTAISADVRGSDNACPARILWKSSGTVGYVCDVHSVVFWIPIVRHVFEWMGVITADLPSITRALKQVHAVAPFRLLFFLHILIPRC